VNFTPRGQISPLGVKNDPLVLHTYINKVCIVFTNDLYFVILVSYVLISTTEILTMRMLTNGNPLHTAPAGVKGP
jgi:hypothetical protein